MPINVTSVKTQKSTNLKNFIFERDEDHKQKYKLHVTIKPGSHGVVKWARALPVPTSKSVVITIMCERKARHTWSCKIGESTDYQQVFSDNYLE